MSLTELAHIVKSRFDTENLSQILRALEEFLIGLNLNLDELECSLRYDVSSGSVGFMPTSLRYLVTAPSVEGDKLQFELPICLKADDKKHSPNGVIFAADAAYLNHRWNMHNPGYELGYEIESEPQKGPAKAMVSVKKEGFPFIVRGQIAVYPFYESVDSPATDPRHWFHCLNECREKIDQAYTQATSEGVSLSDDARIHLEMHIAGSIQGTEIPEAPKGTVSTYFFESQRLRFEHGSILPSSKI